MLSDENPKHKQFYLMIFIVKYPWRDYIDGPQGVINMITVVITAMYTLT